MFLKNKHYFCQDTRRQQYWYNILIICCFVVTETFYLRLKKVDHHSLGFSKPVLVKYFELCSFLDVS